jgi:hypothetical protein
MQPGGFLVLLRLSQGPARRRRATAAFATVQRPLPPAQACAGGQTRARATISGLSGGAGMRSFRPFSWEAIAKRGK